MITAVIAQVIDDVELNFDESSLLLLNILYAAHVWSRRSYPQEPVEEAEKGLVIEGE